MMTPRLILTHAVSYKQLFIIALITAIGASCGSDGGKNPPSGPTLAERTQAAQQTVSTNSNCTTIGDFYWEIGDVNGSLASGSVGTTYTASTEMDIASASKFIFGAYVVERFKNDLSQANAQALRMESGYVSFQYELCVTKTTVADCFNAQHIFPLTPPYKYNSDFTAADVGMFDYNGGHFQWYAATATDANPAGLGLGSLDDADLASEIKNQLGQEISVAYSSPQLAGGAHMSAANYAQFLRKILSGGLALKNHLGEDPVCTLPGTACPSAIYSPAEPYNWHYSWGHWVEDDSTIGDDGAFSSPGAFGFYPWIDASKKYYGILARKVGTVDISQGTTVQAYKASVMCGRLIRAAFLTGVEQ